MSVQPPPYVPADPEPIPPPTPPPARPAAAKRRLPAWAVITMAAMAAVTVLSISVAVAAVVGVDRPTSTSGDAGSAGGRPVVTTDAPKPATRYATPRTTDFVIEVKVLEKKCFGSAGCNLTYRIDPKYTGGDLDPSVTWEVTYEIKGAEDPIVATFEVTGDTARFPQQEYASTHSSSAKLTAVATAVSQQ